MGSNKFKVAEVARAACISREHLTRILSGKQRNITLETEESLTKALEQLERERSSQRAA